jgi:hypothetical protein
MVLTTDALQRARRGPDLIVLRNERTLRPVMRSTGSQNSRTVAYWKNIRMSRRRWCWPIRTMLRSTGASVSSRKTTRASSVAQTARARVGPRPNWFL